MAEAAFQLIMFLAKNLGPLIALFNKLPDATPEQKTMLNDMAPGVNKAVDSFLAYKPKQLP